MKGQFTLTNLLMMFIVLGVFAVLAPVLQNDFIAPQAAAMQAGSTNSFTGATVAMMQFAPFILLAAIILTAIYYAFPRQEGYA